MTARHEGAIRAAVDELVASLLAAVIEAAQVSDAPERLLDIESASAMLSIGRSRLYHEIGAGRLRSIKVGRRRLIPAGAIADFIGAMTAHEAVEGAPNG